MKKHLLSLLAISSFSFLASVATAQSFPDKATLTELQNYSNQEIQCAEFSCNSVNKVKFLKNNKGLIASFDVSARKTSFVELPFKPEEIKLNSVTIDGKESFQIVNYESSYSVVVPQGEHTVNVNLNMVGSVLSLNQKLPNIEADGGIAINERNGFSIISVSSQDSTASGTVKSNPETIEAVEKPVYPTEAFYQVSRTLYLQNSWKVVTTIRPLFETTQSTTLEIPLLKGEKVLTADIKIENDKAIVNLSNKILTWESSLESVSALEIPAVEAKSYTQMFSIESSSLWKYSIKGKNPFSVNGDITTWALWNGEKLNLEFKAPLVLEGETLALDNLNVSYRKEHETHFYGYSLNAKTSLAGKMAFTLPQDYKIEFLSVNNQPVNINKDTKKVLVDLNFGDNLINFNISTEKSGFLYKKFPHIQFPKTVYNVRYDLDSSDWILYSGGADIQTEYILFSSLIFLLIIAFVTKKISPQLSALTIGFILFGFLQNSIQIMLLLPILLALVKFKDLIIARFEKNRNALEYNSYQFLLITFSIVFIVSFLITLKLGLLDSPSSWTLYGNNHITWFNELYSSKDIWYLELDSTVYHILMFAWAIFVSYHLIQISKMVFQSIFSFELWIKKPVKSSIILAEENRHQITGAENETATTDTIDKNS